MMNETSWRKSLRPAAKPAAAYQSSNSRSSYTEDEFCFMMCWEGERSAVLRLLPRTDFSAPEDPMQHTRRLLGLDGVQPGSGKTRLKSIEGEAFVIDDNKLLN